MPPTQPFAVSADALSQVMDEVRLTSLFCGIIRVTPPFSRDTTGDGFRVILMTHGRIYVEAIDGDHVDRILVSTGDVLVMPRPISYRVHFPQDAQHPCPADHREITDVSKPELRDIEYVGMLCQLDKVHRNLLTDFLPLVIHLKKDTPGLVRWFKRTVELFRAESQTRSLGRASILARLTEMVCVQVLRIWVEQMPGETKGWLQALKDERIALAIQAVHADPAKRWTVASLARRAGMSRTIFAIRFKALVGESPMAYVSRWRMHRAAGLLGTGTSTLKSVAEASGYSSRTTFGANFKRHFGMFPSDYRRS